MRHLVRQQVNSLTPENAMKWETIHPEKGNFDWEQMDKVCSIRTILNRNRSGEASFLL
jgi:GH35 family endo-1,4-beta-xylanase